VSTRQAPLRVALAALFFCGSVLAETAYVRDTLYVPLRAEPNSEAAPVRQALKSGTRVEILNPTIESGYRLVRFQEPNGNTVDGYIQTQYLVSEPIARDQLRALETALEAAEQVNNLLKAELDSVLETQSNAQEAAAQAIERLTQTEDELARIKLLSSDAQNLADQLAQAQKRLETQSATLVKLQSSQAERRQEAEQQWFLIGSGIVFLSLLIGFWVSRRIYHRSLSGGWS
jgi:SH3 domain protein